MDQHGPDAPNDDDLLPAIGLKLMVAPQQTPLESIRATLEREAQPQRKYLPTLAELIDRLAITQLKAIFIPEHAEDYGAEMTLIQHDIDLILKGQPPLDAEAVRAILILMLANRFIWENESKARAGGPEQDKLLKCTHSINGVRNTAKNVIASKTGGRKDWKTDSLAADLPAEFGHWDVFR